MAVDTSPWGPEVATLPDRGFTQVFSCYLTDPGGVVHEQVATALTLGKDGRRSPRVEVKATLAWPRKAVREALTPRDAWTLTVIAGYRLRRGVNADTQPMGTYRVTEVVSDHLAQTVTVTAHSDEAVVIGYPAAQTYSYSTSDGMVAAIKAQVAACFPGESQTWAVGVEGRTFSAANALAVGDDRWEAITDWAEALGAKVWHDQTGWHLERVRHSAAAKVAARLGLGPRGQVTSLVETDALDGWANRAAVLYEVKSGTTAATVTTTAGLAATELTPPRMIVVERKRPPDHPRLVARHVLARALRRSLTVTVEATSYLWVTPQDTVTVATTAGQQLRLLVESVEFTLHAGTMRLSGQRADPGLVASITTSQA